MGSRVCLLTMPAGGLRGRRGGDGGGGAGGPPTYGPQYDPQGALIILNIHKWGNNCCWPHPSARVSTNKIGSGTWEPIFSTRRNSGYCMCAQSGRRYKAQKEMGLVRGLKDHGYLSIARKCDTKMPVGRPRTHAAVTVQRNLNPPPIQPPPSL